jgi:hypothetical protein
MEDMIETHMPPEPPTDQVVRFEPTLTYSEIEHGFRVSTAQEVRAIQNPPLSAYLKELGRALQRGDSTPSQLVLKGIYQYGVSEARVRATLARFLAAGILDETSPATLADVERVARDV